MPDFSNTRSFREYAKWALTGLSLYKNGIHKDKILRIYGGSLKSPHFANCMKGENLKERFSNYKYYIDLIIPAYGEEPQIPDDFELGLIAVKI